MSVSRASRLGSSTGLESGRRRIDAARESGSAPAGSGDRWVIRLELSYVLSPPLNALSWFLCLSASHRRTSAPLELIALYRPEYDGARAALVKLGRRFTVRNIGSGFPPSIRPAVYSHNVPAGRSPGATAPRFSVCARKSSAASAPRVSR